MSDEAADIAKASDDIPIACPLHSFAAGTDVVMADGTRKDINTITPGDWVLATDPDTGLTQPREVTTTYQHNDTGLTQLTITNGTTTSTITATGWHPIWYETRHDWINIADLQPGEQLHTGTHQPAWVLTTTPVHGTQPMYDLTIHTTHTYYIHTNDQPLLVHNNGGGSPPIGGKCFPGQDALNRVPEEWGPGVPTNKGEGVRWTDPSNPGNGIRIDKGSPLNSQPTQRVDHVVVRSEGEVLGRSGSPIAGSIKANAVEAHIPLSEWLTWQTWNLL